MVHRAHPSMSDKPTDEEKLLQKNRELGVLHEVAAALNGSIELRDALDTALAKAGELLGLETGWIWLLDEHSEEPYLAAARRLPPALVDRPKLMEGSCYCLDIFRAGDHDRAANINVFACSRLKKLSQGTEGFRFHASVPLVTRNEEGNEQKLGVLNLASRDWRRLTDDELRMLRTVGDLVSIAIERTRLFSRSTELGAVEERNRLARDIHDTLAQSLTGIVMQLETADALLEARFEVADEIGGVVRRALELSRRALEEARRSVHDLRAAPLEGRTLAEALESLCATHEVGRSAEVSFAASRVGRQLPKRVEAGLFRICQEALNNVAAHARAKQVEVCLTLEPAQTRLEIGDDGVGFDPDGHDAGTASFGLVGMNERARLMGGELEIETSWTEGTRVVVVVPAEEIA